MSFSIKNFIILFLFFSFIYSVDIKDNKNKKIDNNEKECNPIEECNSCSFEELKTIDECQITGYKKKMKCINKNNEDKIYYESCNENTRINSVYIFFIICIIIFFCSYKYQKTQKDLTLKNLMVKLSILKN